MIASILHSKKRRQSELLVPLHISKKLLLLHLVIPNIFNIITVGQTDERNFTDHFHKKNKTRPLNFKMQSTNPIYEGSGPGPVYEPLPGESLKHPNSTPTTPQADYAIRYPVPSLPLLRKISTKQLNLKSEDEKTELPTVVLSDEYMIMHKSLPKDTEATNSTSTADSDNIKLSN